MGNGNDKKHNAIAVLGWDMTHNALGRAWTLAEVLRHAGYQVDVAGPLLLRPSVWLPLRTAEPPVHAFNCTTWPELMRKTVAYVESHPHHTVLVSKPRFSSMFMGLEYKRRWGARVIVDVDDWELAFVDATEPVDPRCAGSLPKEAFDVPPSDAFWTRMAEGMMDMADAVTVSNPALQRRFGGTIVRHSRDARVFDAALIDAEAMRRKYGLPPDKRLVMFLGTPSRHKGVADLLSMVEGSGAQDLVLCVVDLALKPALRAKLTAINGGKLMLIPPVPFDEVAALLSTADFVCLPLDAASQVSAHQVPCKITDAIALRVPVLMAPSPAVADLFDMRIFANEGPLDAAAFARAINATPEELAEITGRAHRVFMEEFSNEAVARTLTGCIREAGNKPLPAWVDGVFEMADRLRKIAG